MAATATFTSISHPLLFFTSFIPKPKHQISSNSCNSHPSFPSPLKLAQPHLLSSSRYLSYPCPAPLSSKRWELSAHQGTFFLSDISPVPVDESAQELVSTTTDGGGSSSSIVSVLIFAAFIGLCAVTIGLIYIAVTDFFQKKEREKFQKEEAARDKNRGKKGKIRTRARAGPRGFGQKIEETEIDDSVTE